MPSPKLHYIPEKSLLANFTNKDGMIWVINSDGYIYLSNPQNEFKENLFYTPKTERALSQIESDYIEIFRNKICKASILTGEERGIVSLYVLLFLQRTKAQKDHFRENYEQLHDWLKKMDEGVKQKRIDPKLFSDSASGHKNSFSIKDLEVLLSNYSDSHSNTILSSSIDFVPYLMNMNWCFMHYNGDDGFVGSDNPLAMVAPEREKRYGIGSFGSLAGLAHIDVEITMPLSSRVCFWASRRGIYSAVPKYLSANLAMVKQINYRTARTATKLFSNMKENLENIEILINKGNDIL